MYSQFCYYIQQDKNERRATMRINRKPAEQVAVDWAGNTVELIEPYTGEIVSEHIFVGVMTYSQYAYVEAFPDEKQQSWIDAHVYMYEYYNKTFPKLSVKASQMSWALDDGLGIMLLVMQSDITLSKDKNVLIIDAKYYFHTTQKLFDKHTIHSYNLYPIFTYVKNKDMEYKDDKHTVSGMLLYAMTDKEI